MSGVSDPRTFVPPAVSVASDPFPPNSRYHGLGIVPAVDASGREVMRVARRLVPAPERFAEIGSVEVREGDRLDLIAEHELGDPELQWRIADANRALIPAELTARNGRRLRVTLPEGLPVPNEDQ